MNWELVQTCARWGALIAMVGLGTKALLMLIEHVDQVKRERALEDEHRQLMGELRAEAALDDGVEYVEASTR